MLVVSLLSFVSALAYLLIGLFALRLAPRSPVNRAFFATSLCTFLWAFGYTFLPWAATPADAQFWDRVTVPGWAFFSGTVLHFALSLTGRLRRTRAVHWVALYGPGVVAIAFEMTATLGQTVDYEATAFGWAPQQLRFPVWFVAYAAYALLYVAAALVVITRWAGRAATRREFRQGMLVVTAGSVALVLGALTDFVLPAILGRALPQLSHIVGLIWAIAVLRAIVRHRLMGLSPSLALDQILSGIRDLVILVDDKGRVFEVNRQVHDLLGCDRSHLLARPFDSLCVDAEAGRDVLARATGAGLGEHRAELVLKAGAGDPVLAMVTATAIRGCDDDVVGVAVVAHDVRPALRLGQEVEGRRRAEEGRATEHERLLVTLQSIADGVIATDTRGRVELMNPVAEDLTGWRRAQAVGRPIGEVLRLVDATTRVPLPDPVVVAGEAVPGLAGSTLLVSRDGTERFVARSVAEILDPESRSLGLVVVFRDITRRKKMEEDVLKANRIESIGVLAGGIAHDFNNLLTAILGYISLARQDLPAGGLHDRRLGDAESACLRAQSLTQQLLTFSRGGSPVRKTVTLGTLLRQATGLVLSGSSVRGDVEVAPDLWPVSVDEGQIGQAVDNLLINALQAMPGGGTVRAEAANAHLSEPLVEGGQVVAPGDWVRITVADQGAGIPRDLQARIFEPFFTTKPHGSGLGLAMTWSVVRKHDGVITIVSQEGKGATFRVYLPRAQAQPTAGPKAAPAPRRRSGRILVMDDHANVRDVASDMLRSLGYEVAAAADGTEAVDEYRRALESGRPFVAVILDFTVRGGMGGAEALRHLRAIDPAVRAIISSGYYEDPVMSDYQRSGFAAALPKPYRISQLDRVVAEVIGRE